MKMPVCMDHSATSPARLAVAAAMAGYFGPNGGLGNLASRFHEFGRGVAALIEAVCRQALVFIDTEPRSIVWNAAAAESIDLAIKDAAAYRADRGIRRGIAAIEHASGVVTREAVEPERVGGVRIHVNNDSERRQALLGHAAYACRLRIRRRARDVRPPHADKRTVDSHRLHARPQPQMHGCGTNGGAVRKPRNTSEQAAATRDRTRCAFSIVYLRFQCVEGGCFLRGGARRGGSLQGSPVCLESSYVLRARTRRPRGPGPLALRHRRVHDHRWERLCGAPVREAVAELQAISGTGVAPSLRSLDFRTGDCPKGEFAHDRQHRRSRDRVQ